MRKWIDLSDHSVSCSGEALAFYEKGGWSWEVRRAGKIGKRGTAEVCRADAKRQAEEWLDKIDRGELDPPNKDREELERRLYRARGWSLMAEYVLPGAINATEISGVIKV